MMADESLKGALIPIVALTRGFPLAPFGWSGTGDCPMMADGSLLRSGGETWGPVWPDNVQKTGVSPGGQSGSPSWPPRRSRSSELEERPGHGSDPRFCALQACFLPHGAFSLRTTERRTAIS
jgi:hypothetical protein